MPFGFTCPRAQRILLLSVSPPIDFPPPQASSAFSTTDSITTSKTSPPAPPHTEKGQPRSNI
ncbi:hypothetical protein Mapa_013733 [Marchantia paleacea]|nr:hypothetical protein Mapa_013733 [Marchantia paleacea]